MKIWYQSLFDGGRMPAYFEGLKERAKDVARPGVEVEFHGMPAGAYGDKLPSDVARHPYLMSLHIQFILDNALRAEAEGYDVFAIGSVQDPGMEEARALVDIPVVGYGESAMHFACLLGSRFAVIAFQDGFDQMMDLRVKRLGLSERGLPTALMDAAFADISKGLENPHHLVDKFRETARSTIAQGAEALIPGQLYLSEAIARAGITRIDEVPIVDGLTATLKMAEAMADMKRLGIGVTRRGFTHARPSRDMIDHARHVHGRAPVKKKP
jgi:Asp/Glu/hydantoin racemase